MKKYPRCFVIDDTDIDKCGRTFEGISKIYSHIEHCYLFGFKLLLICYWDGKSLTPCGLSLHRESKKNNYGLTEKQRKRQFTKKRDGTGYFQELYYELDEGMNVFMYAFWVYSSKIIHRRRTHPD